MSIPRIKTSVQSQQCIDLVCDRFEAAIRAGQQPQIEDYLADSIATTGPALLRALLDVELELRLKAGESPSPPEYLERFPEDAALVEAAFSQALSHKVGIRSQDDTNSLLQASEDTSVYRSGDVPAQPIAQRIGRFEVLELLGEGGFGRVYRARDPKLGRDVALKVLREEILATQDEIMRFQREGQAAAKLRHTNICPVYEIGDDDGTRFIVMAYIHGGTLADHLAGKELPREQIIQLASRLVGAAQYAHEKGVVHRDLKPSNVMIDADNGEPVIMDFGLANCAELGRRRRPNPERSSAH